MLNIGVSIGYTNLILSYRTIGDLGMDSKAVIGFSVVAAATSITLLLYCCCCKILPSAKGMKKESSLLRDSLNLINGSNVEVV